MTTSYEEAVRIWAGKRLGIAPETIDHVQIDTDSGWCGTDVTVGDPPACCVHAYLVGQRYPSVVMNLMDESSRMYGERHWNFVDLLNEILGESVDHG